MDLQLFYTWQLRLFISFLFYSCGEDRFHSTLQTVIAPPTDVGTQLTEDVLIRIGTVRDCPFSNIDNIDTFRRTQETYYNRYVDADGMLILGTDAVPDTLFLEARKAMLVLTTKHPSLREHLRSTSETLLGLCSEPGTGFYMILDKWRTAPHPKLLIEKGIINPDDHAGACQLLVNPNTQLFTGYCYSNPSLVTFVHEFAHALHITISFEDPNFEKKLTDAYTVAIAAGRWQNMYASVNMREYFAEGVMHWYLQLEPVESYEIFSVYDPDLFKLLDYWLPRIPKI